MFALLFTEMPLSLSSFQPTTLRIPEGSLAKIECNIEGTHEIAWYRDDQVVPLETGGRYKMHTDGYTQALEVTDTVLSDSANYFLQVDGHRVLVSQLIVEGNAIFVINLSFLTT